MELTLHHDTSLAEIIDSFQRKFPFLRLAFFDPAAHESERFSFNNRISICSATLGEIAGLQNPGYITINEFQSIDTIGELFARFFGIYIQVYRRCGNAWVLTTPTGNLTLAEQNLRGAEAGNIFHGHQTTDAYEQL
jgi:hypothetical protein